MITGDFELEDKFTLRVTKDEKYDTIEVTIRPPQFSMKQAIAEEVLDGNEGLLSSVLDSAKRTLARYIIAEMEKVLK